MFEFQRINSNLSFYDSIYSLSDIVFEIFELLFAKKRRLKILHFVKLNILNTNQNIKISNIRGILSEIFGIFVHVMNE